MFEEIKDSFSDLTENLSDKFGGNWFLVGLGVVAVLVIASLFKDKNTTSSGNEMKAVTGITSYPDAVTNADVIIGTLQDSLDYSQGVIIDHIEGLGSDINVNINENFSATNDYINKGLESVENLLKQEYSDIQGSVGDTFTSTGVNTQSLTPEEYKSIMQANSAEWHTATPDRKAELEAQNQEIGAILGASFNSSTGKWSDSSGSDLYDYTEITSVKNNSIEEQMKANSAEWHAATPERKKELEEANKSLGAQLGASFNSSTGVWTDSSGNRVN